MNHYRFDQAHTTQRSTETLKYNAEADRSLVALAPPGQGETGFNRIDAPIGACNLQNLIRPKYSRGFPLQLSYSIEKLKFERLCSFLNTPGVNPVDVRKLLKTLSESSFHFQPQNLAM